MNEVVEFEPMHLTGIVDIEGLLGVGSFIQGLAHKQLGESATVMVDGKVGACGGIHRFWPGSGEAWMSISADKVSPSLMKSVRVCFDRWMENYSRIQAVTRTGWIEGERTLLFLGFKFESVLIKFGPNSIDKSLYARIR